MVLEDANTDSEKYSILHLLIKDLNLSLTVTLLPPNPPILFSFFFSAYLPAAPYINVVYVFGCNLICHIYDLRCNKSYATKIVLHFNVLSNNWYDPWLLLRENDKHSAISAVNKPQS